MKKAIQQKVMLDLTFEVDSEKAAAKDDIKDTVDYDQLIDGLTEVAKSQHFNLLETLGETLLNYLGDNFALPYCRLSLTKPWIKPNLKGVILTLERTF